MEEITTTDMSDEFVVEDVDTLKVLAHPQRLELLRNFDKSRTVKEVAERIDADPTKMYYHVRMMEKAGIIQITETNIISGIIEKHYKAVARSYRISEELITGDSMRQDDFDQIVASIFDDTRQQLRRSIAEGTFRPENKDDSSSALLSTRIVLNDEQLQAVGTRLKELQADILRWTHENQDSGENAYVFTLAFFPIVQDK